MNAITQLRQSEARMVAALDAATATVDQIGTTALDGALGRLADAVQRAQTRLADALFALSAKVGELTQTADAIAQEIHRDLATPEPAPVPPEATPEPDGIDLADPALETPEEVRPTDDAATAQEEAEVYEAETARSRVAEMMGAPSPNGRHEPGKGRRRKK